MTAVTAGGALRARPLGVLIVERETPFAEAVGSLMHRRGWRPHRLEGPQLLSGLSRSLLSRTRPDVALIEPAAMGVPAPEWVRIVTGVLPGLPLVVCARRSNAEERILSLRAGVEHWLAKPVASEELFATLEAVARHRPAALRLVADSVGESIDAGDLRIDPAARLCAANGTVVALTVKELGVLACLASRQGRIVGRGEIFAEVWGWTMLERDRTIDVYVRRLRAKLEAVSPDWAYIHTHKGRGYRFDAARMSARRGREHVGTRP